MATGIVRTVLRDVAQLLETEGWVQGQTFDRLGRHCALGAIEKVVHRYNFENHETTAIYRGVVRKLAYSLDFPSDNRPDSVLHWIDSVVNWNDTPNRTDREVISAFRKAAEQAEESNE